MAAVPVRVEPPGQNPVVEVGYDGQEMTQPALTMTENLAKLARKVDFSQTQDADTEQPPAPANEVEMKNADGEEDSEVKSFQQPAWPWESVRNSLRSALTELCVASDVLAIATKECGKDKRYMVLDGPVQAEQPEQKHFVQLLAKKKAVEVPSKILLAGAEHLRELQAEGRGQVAGQKQEDFHIELLKLRQNWRLKKVGSNILGDLSYRTAGSKFKHSGVFEVSKADTEEKQEKSTGSSLNVMVPSELEGIAYIQVTYIILIRTVTILLMATSMAIENVFLPGDDPEGQRAAGVCQPGPAELAEQQAGGAALAAAAGGRAERHVLQGAVQPAGARGRQPPGAHPAHGGGEPDHGQPLPRHPAHHLALPLHAARRHQAGRQLRAQQVRQRSFPRAGALPAPAAAQGTRL